MFARGAGSAGLSVAFDSVSFGPIDPSTFRFAPPAGAEIVGLPGEGDLTSAIAPSHGLEEMAPPDPAVRAFGTGWETVLALRLPGPIANTRDAGFDVRSLFPLSGSLFSARLVDRGDHVWVLLGAVPQAGLAAFERELS
jgi:hypothetical protein